MSETFPIGEAARRTGTTPKTLRHYEELGLLPSVIRAPNGYRRYRPEDLNRVAFIRRAKALGLTLEEIQELVAVAAGGRCTFTRAELRQVLAHKIADCTQRIEALVAFRTTLEAAAQQITEPDELPADACYPQCAAFAPSCTCLPVPEPRVLDLSLRGKV